MAKSRGDNLRRKTEKLSHEESGYEGTVVLAKYARGSECQVSVVCQACGSVTRPACVGAGARAMTVPPPQAAELRRGRGSPGVVAAVLAGGPACAVAKHGSGQWPAGHPRRWRPPRSTSTSGDRNPPISPGTGACASGQPGGSPRRRPRGIRLRP